MPRHLVERTFPDGLHIPADEVGAKACLSVVDRNAQVGRVPRSSPPPPRDPGRLLLSQRQQASRIPARASAEQTV
jgi:hypothetical protein